MKEARKDNYSLKIDDMLLSLLNDYHKLNASEVASFFGERAEEMMKSTPNITVKSKSHMTVYNATDGKTVNIPARRHIYPTTNFASSNDVYVLRGYYPNTNIPFKMTLCRLKGELSSGCYGKVKLGNTGHHTSFTSDFIDKYNSEVAEAILLSSDTKEVKQIPYTYRKYKCMRPKEMSLYREKPRG